MDGRTQHLPEKKTEKSAGLTGPADSGVLPFRYADADFSWQREQILKSLQAKWAEQLVAFASTYVRRDDAEDIVQAAFISLWNNRINDPDTPADAPFHAYLIRQVRLRALDHRRNRRTLLERFQQALTDRVEFASRWMNPSDSFEGDSLRKTIRRGIRAMTPRCREVYELHYEADLDAGEIAATLGIAKETVRTFIKSGNAVLREHLAREGYGSGRSRSRRQVKS